MPVIVVTRLRLPDTALLDEFSTDAVAAIERARDRRPALAVYSDPVQDSSAACARRRASSAGALIMGQ